MIKNLSRRQAFIVLIVIFIVLGFMYYFFVWKGNTFVTRKIEIPASFPRTKDGPWNDYVWKDSLYAYPPDWVLEEIYPDPMFSNEDVSQVVAFRVRPKISVGADDYIGVGGGTCETINTPLCVGDEPVYTKSRNSEILLVYNTMIKNITK